jgi:MFS family permease
MILFCTFGMIQTFGVYQDYYTRTHLNNHTPSQISWIGSVQVFLLFVIGLPAGKLFDDGHFHLCMISGGIVFVFSSFMLSLAKPHQYYQAFLAQGVGMGLGMGLMFLPAVSIATHYFRAKRSLAMGVVVAGSSLGAVLHPILLNNTFDKHNGFAWGVRYASFLDLGILIIANLLMRTRLPPRQHKLEIGKMFRENLITDVPYLIFMAGAFLVFWGLFIPFFYLQLYAALHGISPTLVTYSVSIMNGAAIFGRTLPNFLADRYGIFNVMVPSTFLTGALVFALMGAKTVPGVVMFGILYGFFSGGFMSLATPAAASFSTNPDQSDLGLRVGVAAAMMGLACLTGNPIAGALLSPPHYTWWRPLLFSTIVMVAGSALLFIAGRTRQPKRV